MAIAATAATVVRILVPMAGRFVAHLWNKITGVIEKDEDAPEIAVPSGIAETLQQQQQQQVQQQPRQQPQQSATLIIPQDPTRITIYGQSPKATVNLMDKFEQGMSFFSRRA